MTDVAQGRRERKKEETRRRITMSALELFHEKGFDAATVDEITERADVAKGTFFNYFPRKEAVLQALSDEWMEHAEAHAAHHGRTSAERILAIFGGAAEAYGEDRALARMLVRVSMERMVCPEPDVARSGLYRAVTEAIQRGQERGEFRPEVEPDAVFGVIASVFMGTLLWWVGGGPHQEMVAHSTLSLHDAVERQLSLVFDGIRRAAAAGAAA
jgi:AcrR family transcriptional regulator